MSATPCLARSLARLTGLCSIVALVACSGGRGLPGSIVNDVTQMNPIPVERIVQPRSIAEVQKLVAGHPRPDLDRRRASQHGRPDRDRRRARSSTCARCDRVLAFSPDERRRSRSRRASRWREIQEAIDPHDLVRQDHAVVRQLHGRGLAQRQRPRPLRDQGPLIRSVRSLRSCSPTARSSTASPTENTGDLLRRDRRLRRLGVIVTPRSTWSTTCASSARSARCPSRSTRPSSSTTCASRRARCSTTPTSTRRATIARSRSPASQTDGRSRCSDRLQPVRPPNCWDHRHAVRVSELPFGKAAPRST